MICLPDAGSAKTRGGAAWSARRLNLPEVAGSNPAPATKYICTEIYFFVYLHLMNTSENLCVEIASETNSAICSFSMGKDSIGTAIQMQRYFERVEYVFMYMIPDLEFQEMHLAYYEKVFGSKIKRMPNPSIYRQINALMYQCPGNIDTIFDKNLFEGDYDDIFAAAKHDFGMEDGTFVGVGVRASDSLARRTAVKATGGINRKRKQFFPIFDWNVERLVKEIRQSGIKLPIDYKIWGRSFDGFDYRFLKPLKNNFPKDYEKIREFFPLVDLELKRYEKFVKP